MIAIIIGITTKTPGTTAAKTISIATESAWTVRRSPEAQAVSNRAPVGESCRSSWVPFGYRSIRVGRGHGSDTCFGYRFDEITGFMKRRSRVIVAPSPLYLTLR